MPKKKLILARLLSKAAIGPINLKTDSSFNIQGIVAFTKALQ